MDSPGPGSGLRPLGNGQPAKVLQLLWRDVVGGAERIAAQLAEEWSATGIRSELAYLDPPGERWDRRSRILRMRRLLRSTDCDVVLSHTALPSLYARLTAPRGLRVVPVLHSGHDDFRDRRLRQAEWLLARRSPVTIAVGERQRQEYEDRFGHLSTCVVINNPVRGDLPLATADRSDGAVVTVARFLDAKGTGIWEHCARTLTAADDTLRFDWWGPPQQDNPAAADFERLRAEGHPRIVVRGATDDVGGVLSRATVFFLPSFLESFSIAVLEALSAGLPVVCGELVASAFPEWLPITAFADRDAEAAAAALTSVLADWDTHKERAVAVAERVKEEFSPRRAAARYAEVLLDRAADIHG